MLNDNDLSKLTSLAYTARADGASAKKVLKALNLRGFAKQVGLALTGSKSGSSDADTTAREILKYAAAVVAAP